MEAGSLFLRFFVLCTLAVGGLNTVMPGMFHYVVDEQGWLTARQFTDLYALGQASPGPNALWVTLIGLQVASWPGAVAATAAGADGRWLVTGGGVSSMCWAWRRSAVAPVKGGRPASIS